MCVLIFDITKNSGMILINKWITSLFMRNRW